MQDSVMKQWEKTQGMIEHWQHMAKEYIKLYPYNKCISVIFEEQEKHQVPWDNLKEKEIVNHILIVAGKVWRSREFGKNRVK